MTTDQQPDTGPATLDSQHGNLFARVTAVLADLQHVRAKNGSTHHDACWDEHIACRRLASPASVLRRCAAAARSRRAGDRPGTGRDVLPGEGGA